MARPNSSRASGNEAGRRFSTSPSSCSTLPPTRSQTSVLSPAAAEPPRALLPKSLPPPPFGLPPAIPGRLPYAEGAGAWHPMTSVFPACMQSQQVPLWWTPPPDGSSDGGSSSSTQLQGPRCPPGLQPSTAPVPRVPPPTPPPAEPKHSFGPPILPIPQVCQADFLAHAEDHLPGIAGQHDHGPFTPRCSSIWSWT